jgi:hypothetical protein
LLAFPGFNKLDAFAFNLLALCALMSFIVMMPSPGATQSATAPDQAGQGTLRPGAVFDADRSLIALMQPQGGIEAVSVRAGDTAWVSERGDKPLAIVGDLLLAQTASDSNQLLLVTLNLNAQGETQGSIAVALPEGVVASIDDSIDHSFKAEGVAARDGIFVAWTDRVQPVAGVERLQQEARTRSGFIHVDIGARTYRVMSQDSVQGLFTDPPPDLARGERLDRVQGVQFRSAGGGYVLTSEAVADNRVWEKYEWTIWERDSGERVGSFRDFQRVNHFAVIGSVLLQEVAPHSLRSGGEMIASPLSVRAIDLGSGRELWRRAIRDTSYSGPLPH